MARRGLGVFGDIEVKRYLATRKSEDEIWVHLETDMLEIVLKNSPLMSQIKELASSLMGCGATCSLRSTLVDCSPIHDTDRVEECSPTHGIGWFGQQSEDGVHMLQRHLRSQITSADTFCPRYFSAWQRIL
jgi:hypothetical protein